MKIAVIGAGASGLVAAIQAAWQGAAVVLFEQNTMVGRKLLVTGSGRCNITNDAVSAEKYACKDVNWLAEALASFGVKDFLAMLDRIGIPVYKTSDGWYYPLSNSAQTVVDAFFNEVLDAGVTLRAASQVTGIINNQHGFTVKYKGHEGSDQEIFDRVIVSAGGKAYPTLGSRGELFPILAELGHTVLEKRPALAPVVVDLAEFKVLQGVRLDAGVRLWHEGAILGQARGNMIFTDWGLNGPAVMDISHHISANPGKKLILAINFLEFFEPEFNHLLNQKRKTNLPVRAFLGAFFPPKAAALFSRVNQLAENTPMSHIDDKTIQQLFEKLKNTSLLVRGVRNFEYCQVTTGGIPVSEVYPRTMESRIRKGLFLTGETLDVAGPCGGYNLQFAFSSGALAGMAAATVVK
jgi:predicted Rossmann fold flavoprotein